MFKYNLSHSEEVHYPMKPHPEAIKAVGISLSTLALGTMIALGMEWYSNYNEYHNKTTKQGNEIKKTKTYSPFSYLELVYENGAIKEVSQKNSLTDREILRFKLNSLGNVEKMVEDSNLWGKANMRTSSPEENKTVNWFAANQTAQEYIAYFQKE